MRLIPAHAGKTPTGSGAPSTPRAHPRSRGENVIGQLLSAVGEGSSPLTRGKHHPTHRQWASAGLIPAHAGKTEIRRSRRRGRRAHPRSRGENALASTLAASVGGSSPLTRGKPNDGRGERVEVRLIPAHAGKTGFKAVDDIASGAHPRSRGENHTSRPLSLKPSGSSPLTRGKPWAACTGGRGSGLIPAHAGKTIVFDIVLPFSWAHPRSRGENSFASTRPLARSGSSPLTRGKLHGELLGQVDDGLIPAHAGKTTYQNVTDAATEAHPRSRGENRGEGMRGP